MDFTDDECCTHSDLLDVIFDMSDLNIDQFDVNFGLAIFISYGQFASTATRASSSTSRNFLCRLQLRGDSRKRCCMPCLL